MNCTPEVGQPSNLWGVFHGEVQRAVHAESGRRSSARPHSGLSVGHLGSPTLWLLSPGHARESDSAAAGRRKLLTQDRTERTSIAHKVRSYGDADAPANGIHYSFLTACPPNSFRSDDSSLSAKESSSRERKRSISDSVITGADTLSSSAASTVQRPSPESTT